MPEQNTDSIPHLVPFHPRFWLASTQRRVKQRRRPSTAQQHHSRPAAIEQTEKVRERLDIAPTYGDTKHAAHVYPVQDLLPRGQPGHSKVVHAARMLVRQVAHRRDLEVNAVSGLPLVDLAPCVFVTGVVVVEKRLLCHVETSTGADENADVLDRAELAGNCLEQLGWQLR